MAKREFSAVTARRLTKETLTRLNQATVSMQDLQTCLEVGLAADHLAIAVKALRSIASRRVEYVRESGPGAIEDHLKACVGLARGALEQMELEP